MNGPRVAAPAATLRCIRACVSSMALRWLPRRPFQNRYEHARNRTRGAALTPAGDMRTRIVSRLFQGRLHMPVAFVCYHRLMSEPAARRGALDHVARVSSRLGDRAAFGKNRGRSCFGSVYTAHVLFILGSTARCLSLKIFSRGGGGVACSRSSWCLHRSTALLERNPHQVHQRRR